MNNLSDRIQTLINLHGRKKLSELTGISTTQLHRLRAPDTDTTRKNLISIEENTGVNLLWITKGEGPMMKGDPDLPPPPPPEFTKDEIEMINSFRSASLQTKMKAFQVLNEEK